MSPRYAQYMLSQSGIIWQNPKNTSQWMTLFPTWLQEMLAHLERARGGHARKSWSINFFVQIFYERELEKGMCEKVDQLTQLCYRSLAATWAHSMMGGGKLKCPSTMIQNDHCWPWSKLFTNLLLSLLWIIVFLFTNNRSVLLLSSVTLRISGVSPRPWRVPATRPDPNPTKTISQNFRV